MNFCASYHVTRYSENTRKHLQQTLYSWSFSVDIHPSKTYTPHILKCIFSHVNSFCVWSSVDYSCMIDHIHHIYEAFLPYEFFCVMIDCHVEWSACYIHYTCKAFLLCEFFCVILDCNFQWIFYHIHYIYKAFLLCEFFYGGTKQFCHWRTYTNITFIRLFSSVYSFVDIQLTDLSETFTTHITLKWIFSGVNSFMFAK